MALLAPRPLFVIHGTADSTIPVEQAIQIYRAAQQPKELWLAEGAEHCGAYFQDRCSLLRACREFLSRYLGRAERDAARYSGNASWPLRSEEPA